MGVLRGYKEKTNSANIPLNPRPARKYPVLKPEKFGLANEGIEFSPSKPRFGISSTPRNPNVLL